MFPRILLGALLALALPAVALAKPPMETNQLVDGDGTPIGTASNPLNVTGGGGGGGGSTGSVTAAGTNGTQAQAVQGINGGVNVGVSATSWPLPTGAATAAKQPAFGTAGAASADVLSVQGVAGGVSQNVSGAVASGATDSGNPVKVGGVYNATLPTFATGQRGDLQLGMNGQAYATILDPTTGQSAKTTISNNDAQSSASYGLLTSSRTLIYNGSTWDRSYTGLAASNGTGVGTTAAVIAPVSGAVGIVPVVTTNSGVVGKASAGNLYGFGGTMGGTAGFLALLNATAVPAAGAAITPVECVPVAAQSSYRTRQDIPDRYSTGIVLLSTSSCTTYTAVTPVLLQVMDQ